MEMEVLELKIMQRVGHDFDSAECKRFLRQNWHAAHGYRIHFESNFFNSLI
jgi:hypothetical protein